MDVSQNLLKAQQIPLRQPNAYVEIARHDRRPVSNRSIPTHQDEFDPACHESL